MTETLTFPKLASVEVLPGHRLLATFRNGDKREYDCTPLLEREAFEILRTEAFFRAARVEENGYAVIWSDDIDLAESELWLNGTAVD